MAFQKQLPKKSEDLSGWYNALILQAGLADYGPAKGTMIFRPYGYALWEAIQRELDPEIKKRGVENAYFPLFIPERLLHKEKQHIEGFSPELAVVTIGGGEKLEEPLVIRPTSETIMYDAFSRWIKSWRDLPFQINQWANVVRWEKRTYMFLRTSEFLWQEGHTAHATHEEALETMRWAMKTYTNLYRDFLALPGYVGRKSETEKFAGAVMTLTYEMMMPEGKALQSCTSHDLGQNFSKSFGIQFQDKDAVLKHPWQTSWGLSTRSVGGMILVHGDDKGLRLPPRIAPIQVVILPVRTDDVLIQAAEAISLRLAAKGYRAKVDKSDASIGWKMNEWELKGVPMRIEVGKRELETEAVTVARRDSAEKMTIKLGELEEGIGRLLDEIHANLLAQATELLKKNTHEVKEWPEFRALMGAQRGFLKAFWCGDAECEAKIKEETKATTRCLAEEGTSGKCVRCSKASNESWYFGQSY